MVACRFRLVDRGPRRSAVGYIFAAYFGNNAESLYNAMASL